MAGAASAAAMAAYGRGELSRGRESLHARGRSSAGVQSQPYPRDGRGAARYGEGHAALGVRTDGVVANLAMVTTHKEERGERATHGLDIFDPI